VSEIAVHDEEAIYTFLRDAVGQSTIAKGLLERPDS